MKTIYFKTEPVKSWQKPTYYKIAGTDNDIQEITIWNRSSLDINHVDDETFNERLEFLKLNDLNNPLKEITRDEFDLEYIGITNKLNALAAV